MLTVSALILSAVMAVAQELNLNHENLGHLLPQPRSVQLTGGVFSLTGNVAVTGQDQFAGVQSSIDRFITSAGLTQASGGSTITITKVDAITGTEDHNVPEFDNEAYKLIISSRAITIEAVTRIGVIRAMQTLEQLLQDYPSELPGAEIVDWPAFKIRGYMHDIGRSYISVAELKQEIDLLSRFKENVFFWHITDKHGFRFESKLRPSVNSKFTATRSDKFYTQEECKEIQDYAWERGMTIIPEIDMPGHSAMFEPSTGYTMTSPEGKAILKDVLTELAQTFDKAPYIHIGGDETGDATVEYINEMADHVKSLGRKVVVWNCYGRPAKMVDPSTMHVDMCTNWGTAGRKVTGIPNIDMRYNYINHFDMFGDLAGIYRSNIFYETKGTDDIAGTITGLWNDRLISDEKLIIKENNLYANAIASAERAWKGGGKQYIEAGGAYLPNRGDEYEEFKDWETRFIFHKSRTLQPAQDKIPYVAQSDIRWNLTKSYSNGGDKTMAFDIETNPELTPQPGDRTVTGAGIWLNHIWAGTIGGVLGKAAQPTGQTRYAWTYVFSPSEQQVGLQFQTYDYSRSQMGASPANGTWDNRGSKIWINDNEITPNVDWTTTGSDEESELGNINFTARAPIPVTLKQGWNKVLIKLPNTGANIGYYGGKWQYTCFFTDLTGTNAIEGLIYNPNKSESGEFEDNIPLPPFEVNTGKVYSFKCKRQSRYVTSSGIGGKVKGINSLSPNTGYWYFEQREDGKYNLVNFNDGGMIDGSVTNNTALITSKTEPGAGWETKPAATDGYYIFVSGTSQFNQQNNGEFNVLNWGGGANTTDDGCQYLIEEVAGLTPDDAIFKQEKPDIPSDATIVKIISGDNSNDQAGVKSIGFTVPTTDVKDKPFTSATLWNINIFTKTGNGATNSYLVLSTSTNIADKVAVSTNNPTPAGSFAEYTFENTSIEAGKTYYMLFTSDAAGTTQVNQRVAISGTNGSGQMVVDGNGTAHSDWIPYYIVNNVPVPVPLDFFNESVDDIQHWVRISNVRNNNFCLYADDKDALHSHMTEASESESFALIGDENNFTIYSKTKQTFFGSANANQDTPVLATSTGTTYKLIAQAEDGVYVIAPTANENQSFNMHGGAGNDIKYYAASDGGSTWRIAELGGSLTIRGMVDGNILPINNKVGVISITANGSSSNVKFNLNGRTEPGELETVTITVPKAKQWTIAEGQGYSGYDCSLAFNGETKEQIVLDELPQESEVITATFTANDKQNLFYTVGHGRPYRIPAIAKAKNGDLIAISDDRFCGADIGYGRVDLVYKVSHDNGMTWSVNDLILAQGDGNNESKTCGYGDAAICADRTSDKVMVMAVSAPKGGTCWTAAQRGVITWGTLQDDGTWKWEVPVDIKDELMALLPTDRINYFVGSGKISQSRIVKKGDYYRVYVALWTTNGSDGDGLTNYVIYSDEFGKPGSWQLLGSKSVRPVPGGDEPKAEELPDGRVVVSGRKSYGRYYNIFKFKDETYTTGYWGTAVASHSVDGGLSWGGNSTNGEIMVVKAKNRTTNAETHIVLQSAPAGNDRSLVSIWYKLLDNSNKYATPTAFSQNWTKGMQVSDFGSAYSTMCVQADGKIAFFFEDSKSGAGYDMVYQPIALSQLAGLEDYEIVMEEEDDDTAVTDIISTRPTDLQGKHIYTLTGVRQSHPTKGVNIVDGVKVIVK